MGSFRRVTVDRPMAHRSTEDRRRFPGIAPRLSLAGPSLRRVCIAVGLVELVLIGIGPALFYTHDPDRKPFGLGLALALGGVVLVSLIVQFLAVRSVLGLQIKEQRKLREFTKLLDETIEQERLRVVFQPIFRASDGAQVGVEALARFDADNGMCPESWFVAAHAVGRTQQLEMLALRLALRHAADLPQPLYLALNVSPATFVSAELRAVILASPLPKERIILELTEHVAIDDYGQVIASRQLYREANVRVAIDDTGAGFSSFRHVIAISPDIIKMDHSLAKGVDEDPLQSGLVAAVLTFARSAGIVVIAEGVETTGQLMRLTQLGVDQIQGHLLGAPVAPPPIVQPL